jgi:beta-glucosidase
MTGFTLIMEDGTEVAYDVADYDPEASTEGLTVSRAGMEDTKSVIPVYDGMEIVFPYVEFEGAKAIRIEGASDGCAVEITSQGTKTLGYYEFTESVGKDAGYGGISGGTEDLELMTGGQTNADMTFKFTSVPLDFSAEAAEIAADADVTLLFVGADTNTATESNDRDTLDLPGTQDELIAAVTDASDQVVVSVMSMNMVEAEDFKDKAEALLWYGFNGQVQGTAIIETLFGDANPSGHLPFTWYKSVNDLPNINDYSLTSAAENSDSTGRTYMYYDGEISYPFGYGLSYTTFEISNLTIDQDTFTPNDTLTFTVDVTNTGDVAGKEVVQLYYSAPDAAEADRPNKQLIGFDKVELEPSETKTVTMTVKAADLWYYEDEDGDSLNQEETPQGDGTLNTSPDLVINGNIAYLNGDYVFEAATAASNMDNTGAAEDSLTVSATMDGALELQLQNVTIETGTVDSGKPQFLETGDTVQTVTSVALNNDTFLDLSEAEVTYSSNREDVVTVDSDGLITAQGTGVATITATVTYNGSTLTSECAVKVM